jgi:hypothetical protein
MPRTGKEIIDAAVLAEHLLQHALQPAVSPELKRECSQHYLDELVFFSLFIVDYALGLNSATRPIFATVRQHYNEGIDRFCDSSKEPHVMNGLIAARFTIYSDACNANTTAPKQFRGKTVVLWELGKAFSRLSSDTRPWVPSASEVLIHVNIFLRECKRLSDFLEQYEVTA